MVNATRLLSEAYLQGLVIDAQALREFPVLRENMMWMGELKTLGHAIRIQENLDVSRRAISEWLARQGY